jgi:hypothetical protein
MTPQIVIFLIGALCGSGLTFIGLGLMSAGTDAMRNRCSSIDAARGGSCEVVRQMQRG